MSATMASTAPAPAGSAGPRSDDAHGTRGRPVVLAAAATVASLTVVNRIRMRRNLVDLQVYRKGAWALLHGRSPYSAGLPGPHLPYTYTPFSTEVFAPMAVLPLHLAMVAHTFVSIAALFVGVALVARELDGRGSWSAPVIALAVAATVAAYWSEPVSQTLGYGQINLVLMALVLVDILAMRGRPGTGVLIGIAAGIKLTPLIFVAYLLLTRRHRAAITAALTAAATVALGWLLMPAPTHRYFLHLMFDDRRVGAPGFVGNQSLNGMWVRLAHGYGPSRPFWALSAAAVLAVGLWTARRIHARFGDPHGLAIAAVTGLLVSPISWSHHWVWFVVPSLIVGWSAWQRRSALLGLAAAAWTIPFYLGPFWHIAHRNYRAVPPVGWQRPLADAYTLVGLVALAIVATWELVRSRHDRREDGALWTPDQGARPDRSDPALAAGLGPRLANDRSVIVVPTLDEALNIECLLRALRRACPDADILVVDDGSGDGTPELAEQVGTRWRQIHVWRRVGPRGLGAAYRAGFARALDEGYGIIAQMDADLSHDPLQVAQLIEEVRTGADLAIGSRYVPGGSTPGWPLPRRVLSRAGGTYARTLLRLPVHDVTSGFRAYRADLLRTIDLTTVDSTGFAFQIDMTDRAARAGAQITEVPITFRDRTAGESKMSGAIASEALALVTGRAFDRTLERLPLGRLPVGRLVRCAGVSVLTTLLSLVLIVVGTQVFGLAAMAANVVATAIATVPSYSLNRRWTWRRTDRSDPWREVLPFWVLSFAGLALSTITVGIADAWASEVHLSALLHTGALLVGHLGGFGMLWIVQFLLLDRVLFADRDEAPQVA